MSQNNRAAAVLAAARETGRASTQTRFNIAVGGATLPLAALARQLARAQPPPRTASVSVQLASGGQPPAEVDVLALGAPPTPAAAAPADSQPVLELRVGTQYTLDVTGLLGYAAVTDDRVAVRLTVDGTSDSRTLTRALAFATGTLAARCPGGGAAPAPPPPPTAPAAPAGGRGRVVRYVRVQIKPNLSDFLNIAGLQVWDGTTRQRPIAGTQSGEPSAIHTWRNLDDDDPQSIFHSDGTSPQFVELDFGPAGVPCTQVRVLNRSDCCAERLAKFQLHTKDPAGNPLHPPFDLGPGAMHALDL